LSWLLPKEDAESRYGIELRRLLVAVLGRRIRLPPRALGWARFERCNDAKLQPLVRNVLPTIHRE